MLIICLPRIRKARAISAFENALKNANIKARQVGWINLHGTVQFKMITWKVLLSPELFGKQTPLVLQLKPIPGIRWVRQGLLRRRFCGESSADIIIRRVSFRPTLGSRKRLKICPPCDDRSAELLGNR